MHALKFEQESTGQKPLESFHVKDKKEMSNTDTGAMIKQQLLNDVEKVLVEQIDHSDHQWHEKHRGGSVAISSGLTHPKTVKRLLARLNHLLQPIWR